MARNVPSPVILDTTGLAQPTEFAKVITPPPRATGQEMRQDVNVSQTSV